LSNLNGLHDAGVAGFWFGVGPRDKNFVDFTFAARCSFPVLGISISPLAHSNQLTPCNSVICDDEELHTLLAFAAFFSVHIESCWRLFTSCWLEPFLLTWLLVTKCC